MNVIRKYIFPNMCISFTLVIICSELINILNDNYPSGYHSFILQLAGITILICAVDYFIDRIKFKYWVAGLIIMYLVNYIIVMAASFILYWSGFRLSNIIYTTAIYSIVFAIIVYHNYKVIKQNEEWINRMLEKRNNNSSSEN